MTGEQFMTVYNSVELRQSIMDFVKSRTKRVELQEDYLQEAWLWISLAPGEHDPMAYLDVAEKAIKSARWQEEKNNLTQEDLDDIYEARMLELGRSIG
jgi:hypothetical protein